MFLTRVAMPLLIVSKTTRNKESSTATSPCVHARYFNSRMVRIQHNGHISSHSNSQSFFSCVRLWIAPLPFTSLRNLFLTDIETLSTLHLLLFLWRISRGVEVAVQSGYYNSICTVISVLQQQKQGVLEGLSTWSQRNIPADAFGWSKYKASVSLFIQRKQKERKKKGHYHLVFRAWSNSAATTS